MLLLKVQYPCENTCFLDKYKKQVSLKRSYEKSFADCHILNIGVEERLEVNALMKCYNYI